VLYGIEFGVWITKCGTIEQVFFYLDPKLLKDASMDTVNNITLSYTFFKTDDEEYEENEPVDGKKQAVQSGTP
jgi:cytochrome c oxidase assembly protein Cox11